MTNNFYHQISESLSKGLKIALIGLLLTSCGVTKRIVDVEREVITYKDSTIYHQKDSIVLIPVEKIVDIVPSYDTLKLETSLAKSKAYVDTLTHSLKGSIENKDKAQFQYKIVEVERLVERTDTLVRTETIEIPVEVKVPVRDKWFWGLVLYLLVSLLGLALFIKHKLLL